MPTRVLPYNIDTSGASNGQVLAANSTGGVQFITPGGSNWTVDSSNTSNIYRNSMVGIGANTSPTSQLDINGTTVQNVAVTNGVMDLSTSQVFTDTVTAATTFSFTNVPASRSVTVVLHITNGAAFTLTWPAAVKWPGGTAPTLTNPGVDILVFHTVDGGTNWRGNLFGKDIK